MACSLVAILFSSDMCHVEYLFKMPLRWTGSKGSCILFPPGSWEQQINPALQTLKQHSTPCDHFEYNHTMPRDLIHISNKTNDLLNVTLNKLP